MVLSLFCEEAWPYLKFNNIPFILFVSTEPIGKNGYMTWDQILEIENSNIGYIGHHSHTHEYLIDMNRDEFIKDIETASEIFNEKLDMFLQYSLILLENILNL